MRTDPFLPGVVDGDGNGRNPETREPQRRERRFHEENTRLLEVSCRSFLGKARDTRVSLAYRV